MTKKALALFVAVLAVGCNPIPTEERRPSSNQAVAVDRLFTHEGVTVYRFRDLGRDHYYAVPDRGRPAESFSAWSEWCGKGCVREVREEIPTVAWR